MKIQVRIIAQDIKELMLADIARVSTGLSNLFDPDLHYSYDDDVRLVRALYANKHMTIFEFVSTTFSVEAPIFVRDQLFRYRCASYNARSLRHCEPLAIERPETPAEAFYNEQAIPAYKRARKDGAKKEDARGFLTSVAPTQWVAKYNARELFHIFDQRLTPHAQTETRMVVEQMYKIYKDYNPVITSCWEQETQR